MVVPAGERVFADVVRLAEVTLEGFGYDILARRCAFVAERRCCVGVVVRLGRTLEKRRLAAIPG